MAASELEVIERPDGSWVTNDGELVDIPQGEDALFWAAQRLRRADDQIKQWTRDKVIYTKMIVAKQETPNAVYGDTVAAVRYRDLTTLDAVTLALELEEENGEGCRPVPGVEADIVAYCALSLATGFARVPLAHSVIERFRLRPTEAEAVVAEIRRRIANLTTITGQSRPWVEPRPVKVTKEAA